MVRQDSPPPQPYSLPQTPAPHAARTRQNTLASPDPALGGYAAASEELMQILNTLHGIGTAEELDLPRIVVVGSQSVGKSSLIESLSEVKLPRDQGTCTRCPMEFRLRTSDEWTCQISLRFTVDQRNQPLPIPKNIIFGPKLYEASRSDVETYLRRAQRAILRPSSPHTRFLDDSDLHDFVRPEMSFSSNCVCIEVSGPNVPHLYVYDLPGAIVNVGDGQSSSDIARVDRLIEEYIKKPNCVILLVISCETDFENQKGGNFVLRDPVLRNRTLGVLTKVDLIREGNSERWINLLRNRSTMLRHKWFAVKQPDQANLHMSWKDARVEEKQFFFNTPPWAELGVNDQERLGSSALGRKLSDVLSELFMRNLPQVHRDLNRMLLETEFDLASIPERVEPNPRKKVFALRREVTRSISEHIQGLAPMAPDDPIDGLVQQLNQIYANFKVMLHRTAPRFLPWRSDATLTSSSRVSMTQLATSDDDPAPIGSVIHVDTVLKFSERSRTRELPDIFPFSVQERLIAQATKTWEEIATDCFEEVAQALTVKIREIVREHCGLYEHGGFLAEIESLVTEEIDGQKRRMREQMTLLIATECKPFTQDNQFFRDHRKSLLDRYKLLYRQSKDPNGLSKSFIDYNNKYVNKKGRRWSSSTVSDLTEDEPPLPDIGAALAALKKIGFYGIKSTDLAALLPEDDADRALHVMAEVRAYFEVAYRRFCDAVPTQIDANFVRPLAENIDEAILSRDYSTERCQHFLKESSTITSRREELRAKIERLNLAQVALASAFAVNTIVDPDSWDDTSF